MDLRNTTLDDLAAVIGFSATVRLAAWYGGAGSLYVPAQAMPDNLLSRLIGEAAARRLTDEWGGELLSVPHGCHEEELRRNRICCLLERGFSTQDVSALERITVRRVQQVCRELERAGLLSRAVPSKLGRRPGKELRAVPTCTPAAQPTTNPTVPS